MVTMRASRRRAVVAIAAAGTLALAACGSDEPAGSASTAVDTSAQPTDAATTASPSTEVAPGSADDAPAGDGAVAAAATSSRYDDGGLDLIGTEVGAASNVGTNPFPDLVVDDLNRGKQVNLRNAIPGERPVLLWFWAPH